MTGVGKFHDLWFFFFFCSFNRKIYFVYTTNKILKLFTGRMFFISEFIFPEQPLASCEVHVLYNA